MSNEDKSNIYQLVQNITSKSNGKIAIEARMSSLDLTCAEEAEEDQNFWATLMVAVGILPGLAKTASPIHFEEVWDSRFLKIAAEGGAPALTVSPNFCAKSQRFCTFWITFEL